MPDVQRLPIVDRRLTTSGVMKKPDVFAAAAVAYLPSPEMAVHRAPVAGNVDKGDYHPVGDVRGQKEMPLGGGVDTERKEPEMSRWGTRLTATSDDATAAATT